MTERGYESAKEVRSSLRAWHETECSVPCNNECDAKFGPSPSYRDGLEASMSNSAILFWRTVRQNKATALFFNGRGHDEILLASGWGSVWWTTMITQEVITQSIFGLILLPVAKAHRTAVTIQLYNLKAFWGWVTLYIVSLEGTRPKLGREVFNHRDQKSQICHSPPPNDHNHNNWKKKRKKEKRSKVELMYKILAA